MKKINRVSALLEAKNNELKAVEAVIKDAYTAFDSSENPGLLETVLRIVDNLISRKRWLKREISSLSSDLMDLKRPAKKAAQRLKKKKEKELWVKRPRI